MRKSILLVGLLTMSAGAWAQKSKVRTAAEYLQENNYKKAIAAIDEAVANEDTKNSADAWYYRGQAYLQMALDSTVKSPTAAREATNSFLKALTLKPNYGDEINNPLYSSAIIAFNEGVNAFSNKSYPAAYESFMRVSQIYNAGAASRYAKNAELKKLAGEAKLYAAYASINNQQYDQALPLLVDLKNSQTEKDSNVYMNLIEIYQKQKNDALLLSTINEARGYFPNSQQIRNTELNYYITSGKQAELMPKLEQAVQQDPYNAELWFNLANGYERMAYPKDAAGKALDKPANAAEYISKSETAYLNALKEKGDNADYNYNLGVLYYEAAGALNRQLSDIKGMSAPEQKKYNDILARRDAQFEMALPYFEKAYTQLDPNAKTLNPDLKTTYINSMIGLREIYSRKGNKAKTEELKVKIDAAR